MKLVILDRDGTINADNDDFIKTPEEWVPLPGALEAIARLNHSGWHVVVVSNQSGLGRGLFDMAALNAIHAKMHKMLAAHGGRIDSIFFCPHSPDENCACRKPKAGLFEQIRERIGIDLLGVPVAGDTLRDLLAGTSVGCEPHLILTGKGAAYRYGELPPAFPEATRKHNDLCEFVEFLLSRESSNAAPNPSH